MGETIPTVRGLAAWRASMAFAVDPINCLERYTEALGPVVRVERSTPFGAPSPPAIVMVGAHFNRQVLTATDRLRPTGIWPVRAPAGSAQANLRASYLTTHGAEHASFASSVMPLLERPAVMAHFEAVKRIAAEEIATWPTGRIVDLHELARNLGQHYGFALMLGETDLGRLRRFGTMLAEYHEANWHRFAGMLRVDLPGTPYRRVLRQAEALQAFVLEWNGASASCPHANVRGALCAIDGMSPVRAAAQVAAFALASYETTAATLTWAMLLLAFHPGILADLQAEIEAAPPIADLTADQLDALPLLDGVIRETLRLVTPVPFMSFRMTREGEMAGHDLPRDALLIISPHLTHRHSALYTEPRRFRPERWRDIRPNAYEYLPFSGGPRRCPGYFFASNNLKVALATILPRLSISLAPGARVDRAYRVITMPKFGVPVLLSARGHGERAEPRGSFFELFDLPAAA